MQVQNTLPDVKVINQKSEVIKTIEVLPAPVQIVEKEVVKEKEKEVPLKKEEVSLQREEVTQEPRGNNVDEYGRKIPPLKGSAVWHKEQKELGAK